MVGRRIGFIGMGQMACALARGWVEAELVDPKQITGFDPVEEAGRQFSRSVSGARLQSSNVELVAETDIVVLAVKPQLVPVVAAEIRDILTSRNLIVSIAAGVALSRLCALLGTQRVVRVMPNTPCLIGQGASAYALGAATTDEDAETVRQLLSAVSLTFALDDHLMDAVTGLSGSGPAYVYLLIEALSDGGVRVGLPRPVATALAAQTVHGAAQMVLANGEHPAVLKDRVTSPGGTTIAGLEALEAHAVRAACIAAVVAAAERAAELRDNSMDS